MAAVRAVLIAITILVLAVAPTVDPSLVGSWPDQAAFAAPVDSPSLNDNGDNNNDFIDNGDDDNGNGNDNDDDDDNGNGNGNGNGNDNDDEDDFDVPSPILVPQPGGSPVGTGTGTGTGGATAAGDVTRCFAVGQVGVLTLILPGGSATLDVVPGSSFGQISRVTMRRVAPTSVPAAPGARLDDIVFNVTSLTGCDGAGLGQFPADVNLGIAYSVTADKARLRIARLEGDRWVDVPTVPDPNAANPYISATIRQTGTYTVYSAP